jgi:cell wall-associated NlpC family hydrolase
MKLLAGALIAVLVTLTAVPLSLILLVTAVAAPASLSTLCVAPAPTVPTASGWAATAATSSGTQAAAGGVPVLPAAGSPRYASLNNPPVLIPPTISDLYAAAAAKYGLPWTLLAGIGMEETNHGADSHTSSGGAEGLMQFLPSTWAEYGVDGDGDGRADITNNADSIYSAANYLTVLGARTGPGAVITALHGYNPNVWYGNDVLYYAAAYAGEDVTSSPCVPDNVTAGGTAPLSGTGPAIDTVNAALRWLGAPYSWGGGTASGPTTGICCSPGGQDARSIVGFDCSGLVLYAYAQIGVSLPHLADDITYRSGGQVIPRDFYQMKPGDVIGFSYTPGGRAFHVGIYLGDGQMVNSDGHGVSIATLTTGYYSRLAWHIVRFVN